MKDFLYKITYIKAGEYKGAITAFIFLFILFASYYIAKPVRDSLASDFTDTQVSTLWTITFFVSTGAVMFYNFLLSKISLKKLIPAVFVFFAISFITLGITLRLSVFNEIFLGKVYYVWVSVFALFHISVFWSFMAQIYSKKQSKRLFAFVNVGASTGAFLGSLMGKFFVKGLPLDVVMFIVSASLFAVLPLIRVLKAVTKGSNQACDVEATKLSANPFSGLKEFITHKRLIGIATFLFIFVGIGTFFYMAQKNILADYSRPERTEIYATMDLWMTLSTIILGLFATNRIAIKFGLSMTLALVPVLVAISLLLLASNPTVAMVVILQVLRRAGNYAITRPSREILFTSVDQEARFKTKPFIDIVVYRGGDLVWAWFFVLLGAEGVFKLHLSQQLYVGAGIAVIWAFIAYFVGRQHEKAEAAS